MFYIRGVTVLFTQCVRVFQVFLYKCRKYIYSPSKISVTYFLFVVYVVVVAILEHVHVEFAFDNRMFIIISIFKYKRILFLRNLKILFG